MFTKTIPVEEETGTEEPQMIEISDMLEAEQAVRTRLEQVCHCTFRTAEDKYMGKLFQTWSDCDTD